MMLFVSPRFLESFEGWQWPHELHWRGHIKDGHSSLCGFQVRRGSLKQRHINVANPPQPLSKPVRLLLDPRASVNLAIRRIGGYARVESRAYRTSRVLCLVFEDLDVAKNHVAARNRPRIFESFSKSRSMQSTRVYAYVKGKAQQPSLTVPPDGAQTSTSRKASITASAPRAETLRVEWHELERSLRKQ